MNIEKDLSLLVTRLEKLERQNRFFKILGVLILLAFIASRLHLVGFVGR